MPATQQNYFNLYIPFNLLGNFNPTNDKYSCPKVQNGPRANAPAFPMDSTFALASMVSKEFTIPVEARSRLARSSDPQSNRHELCGATTSGSGNSLDNSSLLNACLGYAAAARPNGSCGTIQVDTGRKNLDGTTITEERKMYRLRRFNAVYPAMYDSNGAWLEGYRTQLDQIYVLDRPAMLAGNKVGSVYGPKPCPYAWHDRRGTTGAITYRATNDTRWIGRNIEGLNLPVAFSDNSCPAVIPYAVSTDPNNPVVRIKSLTSVDLNGSFNPETSHLVNAGAAIIRPTQTAWEPLYLEDTDFKACAPEAEPSQRVDAPVHQIGFTNQSASYCAEVYPTSHRSLTTRHTVSDYAIDTSGEPTDALPQAPLLAPLGRKYTTGDADTNSDGILKALYNQVVYGCRAADGSFPRSGLCCANPGGHQTNCGPPTN
ncbi:hypothetical protein EBZ37_10885 [bacterium]|nr:hypothetical protein [bacterium]